MAGDKTYITDGQGKLHRATRVHAVTPTDIVWSSNPNDYTVQVKIDGKWHRAVLTMDAGSSTFFDNINIDKALVTGADGKQHTALIVKPESTVTLSDIKTDTHGTIAGTTTGETAVSTYSENWSDVKWQDNVNVYKVLVTGSDGKVHTALLTTSAGGGVQAIVMGVAPLVLPDALATSIVSLIAFGGTEQNGTPTPNAPVNIVCNNGAIKFSLNELNPSDIEIGYYRVAGTGELTESPYNFITGFMPVNPGKSYMFFGRRQDDNRLSSYNRIHWFNANKEFISTNSYTKDTIGTGVAPSNAYFAQCSCNESGATSRETTQEIVDGYNWVFQQGSAEVPYVPYVEGGLYTDGPVETINAHGKNLFDSGLFDTYSNGIKYTTFSIANGSYTLSTPDFPVGTQGATNVFIFAGEATSGASSNANGVTSSQARTITVTDGKYTVAYRSYNTNNTNNPADFKWQLERGSTPTAYQPYYNGDTATAEMLLSLSGYTDQQDVITGDITKKVGITVFDGTESWSRATNQDGSANYVFYTQINGKKIGNGMPMLCTHYAYIGSASYVTLTTGKFLSNTTNDSVYFDGGSITTVTNWKNWLATQYANGTPVIAIYPLATETTESVAGQPMATAAGDNTAEITQAGMSGLELEITYMKQGS